MLIERKLSKEKMANILLGNTEVQNYFDGIRIEVKDDEYLFKIILTEKEVKAIMSTELVAKYQKALHNVLFKVTLEDFNVDESNADTFASNILEDLNICVTDVYDIDNSCELYDDFDDFLSNYDAATLVEEHLDEHFTNFDDLDFHKQITAIEEYHEYYGEYGETVEEAVYELQNKTFWFDEDGEIFAHK